MLPLMKTLLSSVQESELSRPLASSDTITLGFPLSHPVSAFSIHLPQDCSALQLAER